MDRVVDAVAQLVSALGSIGFRPPVAIVLESEHEVQSVETEVEQIWEQLLAVAPARTVCLPQPTRTWGVQFWANRGSSGCSCHIPDHRTNGTYTNAH